MALLRSNRVGITEFFQRVNNFYDNLLHDLSNVIQKIKKLIALNENLFVWENR